MHVGVGHLFAAPGAGHRATLVFVILGIVVGSTAVLSGLILTVRWLVRLHHEGKDARIGLMAAVSIFLSFVIIVTGYIIGSHLIMIIGSGLGFFFVILFLTVQGIIDL